MRRKKPQKAVHMLTCFIVAIYPLLLFEVDLGGIHIQEMTLFLCVMGTLLYCFFLIRTGEWNLKRKYGKTDLIAMALTAYELIRIVSGILSEDVIGEQQYYDMEVLILSFLALYFLIVSESIFDKKYFDILIISSLPAFGFILWGYFCGYWRNPELNPVTQSIVNNGFETVSYTVLICSTALYLYCKCIDKIQSFFYMAVMAIGFLILCMSDSVFGIWIMGVVFVAMPVLFRPTAELIKRNALIVFIYLFLLGNKDMISGGINLTDKKVIGGNEQGFYLEIVIALWGAFLFYFWRKIPEGTDLRRLVMRKMRKYHVFLLKFMMAFSSGFFISSSHWKVTAENMETSVIEKFMFTLAEEIQQGESFFYLCLEKQGMAGCILILIFCILLFKCLWRNFDYKKQDTCMLFLVAVLFLGQMLFWQISRNVMPVYFIFLMYGAFYMEEEENVTSVKFNFE